MTSLLSPVQREILLHLNKSNKELYMYEISRGIQRTYQFVNKKIKELKESGLVKCKKTNKNKKKIIVTLSSKGREVVRLSYKIKELLSPQ